MIYVCVPVHNEARTAGLVLWKVRQVFTAFPREYHLLVLDDASTDDTGGVLASYAKVLPMTVVTHRERAGYAASLEQLLRLALQRTDRPKRDSAITLHADFVHSPESMEEMVKHLESGADLVVAELTEQRGPPSRALRLARRWTPRLLPLPGLRDTVSGFVALRLVVLRQALPRGPHHRRGAAPRRRRRRRGEGEPARAVGYRPRRCRGPSRTDGGRRGRPRGPVPRGRAPDLRGPVRAVQRGHRHDAGRRHRHDPRRRGGALRVLDRRRRAVVSHPPGSRVVGGPRRLPLAPLREPDRGKGEVLGAHVRHLPRLRVLSRSRPRHHVPHGR